MRLDKFLNLNKIGSRKEVKALIKKGLIIVNDSIIKDDSFNVDEYNDIVIYNNKRIVYKEFYYILLNKPKDYVSSTKDELYPSVLNLIGEYKKFDLYPVGRLDVDTTGVLLISNDGELTHKLLSSKYHVDKKYFVETNGFIDNKLVNEFEKGIFLDSELTLPSKLEIIDDNHAYVTIRQGMFHQVKKMFEYFGLKVTNLDRVNFGFLTYDGLNIGEYRELDEWEVKRLKEYAK